VGNVFLLPTEYSVSLLGTVQKGQKPSRFPKPSRFRDVIYSIGKCYKQNGGQEKDLAHPTKNLRGFENL